MRSICNHPERAFPLLFILLLSMIAAPAFGGVFEGNGEIGFDLGWVDLDGRNNDEEGRVTFRGGYHFTDYFQLEGQILGIGTGGPERVEALGGIFANAVFNWHAAETVVPYVLVGLGAVEMESFPYSAYHCHDQGRTCHHSHHGHDDRHGYYDDDQASGAVQVAVGSRFFFGRGRTAFRIEGSLLAFEDDFDRERELLSLSVGLTWRLGKYRGPAASVAGTD